MRNYLTRNLSGDLIGFRMYKLLYIFRAYLFWTMYSLSMVLTWNEFTDPDMAFG